MTNHRIRYHWVIAAALSLGASISSARKAEPPDRARTKGEELGQRLIRRSTSDAGGGVMDAIVRDMGTAARRLDVEFDAGDETQSLQAKILAQLDEAIKQAAAQRRQNRNTARSSTSDKRSMSKARKKPGDKRGKSATESKDTALSKGTSSDGVLPDERPVGGRLDEVRRTWGHLPMREREEIIQGISESFLERYREWIERYYRALQETEN